ncbi:MAG: metallophosphoesterase family protein [Anaerolineaceae bacterium]|jgi:diadenosine tetraphosphatase ApaH/serine/threonine PP2A family protein phosphatase|nr:metallophosphoesterase family protein [Anaerolineaceae bacterium]
MRILVISDIHANVTALEAVLNDAPSIEEIWCLGDLVGYGPDPNECIDRLKNLPKFSCVVGNHDAALLGQIDINTFNRDARLSNEWTKSVITSQNLQFLHSLPEKIIKDKVTLVHGSPRNPTWEYLMDLYTATINFNHFSTPYCFVGHTHLPISFLLKEDEDTQKISWELINGDTNIILNNRMIINPGSVGQPRDQDARAAYAIFNTETSIWESRRVEYDIVSVQQRIYALGLPERHALRLDDGW